MTDGLKDRHRAAIIATIAANDRVERAVLFGSRATGTHSVSSDVDIALIGDRLTLTDQARLAAALDEIPMAQEIDLVLYDSIQDETLRKHIRYQSVEWYAKPIHGEANRGTSGNACTWPIMSLRQAGVSLIDCEHRTPPATNDGYPYVGIPQIKNGRVDLDSARPIAEEHFRDWTRKANPQPFDIILSRRCNPGETGFVSPGLGEFAVGQNLVLLRSDGEKIVKPFLRWLSRGPEWWAQVEKYINAGAVFDSLTCAEIPEFRLPIPPLSEQHAIAHILGTLDDKIELNRRMNATLEAMARALFKSWFVDFDPVRAKMEGRDTGLPKEITHMFPDRLVESAFGEIPLGWDIGSLAQHFEAVKGVSYKGSGLGRGGIPLHNLNSVHEGGGYKYEGIKFYAGDYADRHLVRPGDVIVANTEQGHDRLLIGYAAIVPSFFGDHGICSHHVYRLRPRRNGKLSTPFLQLLLNSPMMHDLVGGYANGTTVNMLPIDAVQKPMLSVPPRVVIDTFDTLVLDTEHRREQIVRESRTLSVLRDSLLAKLVSGNLRVNAMALACGGTRRSASVGAHGA